MNIKTIGQQIYTEDIKVLENILVFPLPKDYLEFLLMYNGAEANYASIYVEDLQAVLRIDVFYGLSLVNDSLNILFWLNLFGDEIPPKGLVIANTLENGLILLVAEDSKEWGEKGIYYWDDSFSFPSSNEDVNTYFIAYTFTEFIESLTFDNSLDK
jgi:hypothetical protein